MLKITEYGLIERRASKYKLKNRYPDHRLEI